MRIKTFYAKTMAEALQEIKANMGPDALLLSTKEVRSRSGSGITSSGFEVVAAVDCNEEASLPADGKHRDVESIGQSSDLPDGPLFLAAAGIEQGTYTPASLLVNRRRPESRESVDGKASRDMGDAKDENPPFTSAISAGLYRDLVESGVSDWLAAKLVNDAVADLNPRQRRNRSAILSSISGVVRSMLPDPQIEDGMPGKRVVVFIGPTGVGKTTAIAKLAALLALKKRKKVVLMTLDGRRIGAAEQLKTYASMMGIPFRFIRQVAELPKAIEELGQKDYILVDTAGCGPRNLDAMHDLALLLRETSDFDRHLVLSATTKPGDLKETVDRFGLCKPDHLLFTKVDETFTLGPILNELVRSGKPLSYYSDGQNVPEDLHTGRDHIIDIVLNQN